MLYDTIQTTLCAVLVWASFYRARRTDRSTRRSVRAAICIQASAACTGAIAPWLLRYMPEALPRWAQHHLADAVPLGLLASMVLVQTVTTVLWRGTGVPADFQKKPKGR